MSAFAASLAACGPAIAIDGESEVVYEIVTATGVTLVPKTIRPFFETHLDEIEAVATGGLKSKPGPDGLPSEDEWHYVMLDVAAGDADFDQRLSAARQFPRDRAEAKRLCRRHGRQEGGILPWVVEQRYGLLVVAFLDGDEEAIIREAGVLMHLAADASLPFNTTTSREGESTGNLHWRAKRATPGVRRHRTARHRWQCQLIERFRERFVHEVRVWPGRFSYVGSPVDATFDVLLDAHADLGKVLDTDREVLATGGIADATAFLTGLAEYYDRLADHSASIMESRLEAGALLGANLVGSAWIAAGSPLPARFVKATRPDTSSTSPGVAAESPVVGSRGSKVFHRSGCVHAVRIDPKNLVSFSDMEAARNAGRRPCKTCSSDRPQ